MDTTAPRPPIVPGLRWKYSDHPANGDRLAGQVRVVGPLDKRGGAEMLGEDGKHMDYVTAEGLADPDDFWMYREPVSLHALVLSPVSFEVSFRATVTLDEPVVLRQSNNDYEVTEVVIIWSNRGKRWTPRGRVKGRRVLKSGQRSAHETTLYTQAAYALEKEATDASRPVSAPSITWSN